MSQHSVQYLTKKADERGFLIEILKSEHAGKKPFGHIYFCTAKPGHKRGSHYHTRKTEWFLILKGKGTIRLKGVPKGKMEEFILDGDKPAVVKIPPNVFHEVENTGQEELWLLAYVDESYNPADPDTFRLGVK